MHGTIKGTQVTVACATSLQLAALPPASYCTLQHRRAEQAMAAIYRWRVGSQMLQMELTCAPKKPHSNVLQRSPTHMCSKYAPLTCAPKKPHSHMLQRSPIEHINIDQQTHGNPQGLHVCSSLHSSQFLLLFMKLTTVLTSRSPSESTNSRAIKYTFRWCASETSFLKTCATSRSNNQVYLEVVCVGDKLLEDLCHIQVKQATPVPLGGDALTPLADLGSDHPEGLWLEAGNLLMPLHTKVEGGGLTGAI